MSGRVASAQSVDAQQQRDGRHHRRTKRAGRCPSGSSHACRAHHAEPSEQRRDGKAVHEDRKDRHAEGDPDDEQPIRKGLDEREGEHHG
jgi:hypothetical protein